MNVNNTYSSGNNNMTNMLTSFGMSGIEKSRKSMISKMQKKAIRRMDEAVLT